MGAWTNDKMASFEFITRVSLVQRGTETFSHNEYVMLTSQRLSFHYSDGGTSFSGIRLLDAGQTMNLPLLSNDVLVAVDVAASVSGVQEPVHDNAG